MITVEIYAVLIGIASILFLYTFWDLQNRLYGNIISGFFCGIICFVLALSSASGTVVIGEQQIAYTSENVTGSLTTTSFVYSDPTMVQNLTLLFLFAFIGSVMMVFVAYLVLEAYWENKEPIYIGEGRVDE